MKRKNTTGFIKLKTVFEKLLGPDGCPWDKKQTHHSLLPYLKEEAGEFSSAVRKKDISNMKEELGDVLLQVMLHSEIARRKGNFDIEDVIETLEKKLKRRHPHVFGNSHQRSQRSIPNIISTWEKIKAREKLEST